MRIELEDVTLSVQDTGAGSPGHAAPRLARHRRPVAPPGPGPGRRRLPRARPRPAGSGESSKPAETEAYAAPRMVGDVVGLLDHLGVERAHLVGHDWGAAFAWMTAALVPDRVASVTALSVGHPAFGNAGWEQREKSWYMLLFQFPGVAEEWLSADGFRNLRGGRGIPTSTRSPSAWPNQGAHRRPQPVPRSCPGVAARPAAGAAAGAGPGHGDLEQRRSRPDRGADDGLGQARHRAVALRAPRRPRPLAAAGGPQVVNALLLDFLSGRP